MEANVGGALYLGVYGVRPTVGINTSYYQETIGDPLAHRLLPFVKLEGSSTSLVASTNYLVA
jgi:hypothetical protein